MRPVGYIKDTINKLIDDMDWGEDENFFATGDRVSNWLKDYQGLSKPQCIVKSIADLSKRFSTTNSQLIMVGPTKVFSLCPHHLQVIEYDVWVGYIPCKEAVGLSKLSRVPQNFARYPWIQEEFTDEITKCIDRELKPKGVMVIVKGIHNCMRVRGVKQPNAITMTSSLRGVFKDPPVGKDPRDEMMRLIELGK